MSITSHIALAGFGTAGKGYYYLSSNLADPLTPEFIAIRNPYKKRSLSQGRFAYTALELVRHPSTHLLIEATNRTDEAWEFVSEALQLGKTVITANKQLVASHLDELIELQQEKGGRLLYEAAVAAAIPILRLLETHFSDDYITGIRGIINGSSNYLLTRMRTFSESFGEALPRAKALGLVESDPGLDVDGGDAVAKLSILVCHAFGLVIRPENILCQGIREIQSSETALADACGLRIRLVATAALNAEGALEVRVLPEFCPADDPLFHVEEESNGIVVHAEANGPQFLQGKGAGGNPTGSALLADVRAAKRGFRYRYERLRAGTGPRLAEDYALPVYLSTPEVPDVLRQAPWYLELNCGQGFVLAEVSARTLQKVLPELHRRGIRVLGGADRLASKLALRAPLTAVQA